MLLDGSVGLIWCLPDRASGAGGRHRDKARGLSRLGAPGSITGHEILHRCTPPGIRVAPVAGRSPDSRLTRSIATFPAHRASGQRPGPHRSQLRGQSRIRQHDRCPPGSLSIPCGNRRRDSAAARPATSRSEHVGDCHPRIHSPRSMKARTTRRSMKEASQKCPRHARPQPRDGRRTRPSARLRRVPTGSRCRNRALPRDARPRAGRSPQAALPRS